MQQSLKKYKKPLDLTASSDKSFHLYLVITTSVMTPFQSACSKKAGKFPLCFTAPVLHKIAVVYHMQPDKAGCNCSQKCILRKARKTSYSVFLPNLPLVFNCFSLEHSLKGDVFSTCKGILKFILSFFSLVLNPCKIQYLSHDLVKSYKGPLLVHLGSAHHQ